MPVSHVGENLLIETKMNLTLIQFIAIEKDNAMKKKVREVIEETGFGEVTRTVKIQDSEIILEEYCVTTRKKP